MQILLPETRAHPRHRVGEDRRARRRELYLKEAQREKSDRHDLEGSVAHAILAMARSHGLPAPRAGKPCGLQLHCDAVSGIATLRGPALTARGGLYGLGQTSAGH